MMIFEGNYNFDLFVNAKACSLFLMKSMALYTNKRNESIDSQCSVVR